jgi:hypothetical protein
MCLAALAGLPALLAAGSGAAATAAGTGTFLGLAATTWSGISLASTLAGGLLSGIGQIQQGKAQQEAYNANAKTQRLQALDAERRGSIEEGQQRQRVNQVLGAQQARQGGSGVVAGQDTGADVLAESAEYGARDAATIRVNAVREAWGLRTQAANDQAQGRAAGQAGYARAGSTFLSSVNTFSQSPWWERWKSQSEFDTIKARGEY